LRARRARSCPSRSRKPAKKTRSGHLTLIENRDVFSGYVEALDATAAKLNGREAFML
jgi:hypothetical protein